MNTPVLHLRAFYTTKEMFLKQTKTHGGFLLLHLCFKYEPQDGRRSPRILLRIQKARQKLWESGFH